MKYITLNPMTKDQMLEKAEKAWSSYRMNWTPSCPGETMMDHDQFIPYYLNVCEEAEAERKRAVESITLFDEIVENATSEELAFCLGSKIDGKIREAYKAAALEIKASGDDEKLSALTAAMYYALAVVRRLATGKGIPTQPSEEAVKPEEKEAPSIPHDVIAISQQIAEDMLANDDDGIVMVNPTEIARSIMNGAGSIPRIRFTRESLAAHLIEFQSMEYEGGNACTYYLHMTDDQQMLPSFRNADITFKADRDFTPYINDEDFTRFYYDEVLSNEGFAEVVDDLYAQAVAYFSDLEDDEEE